MNQKNDVFGESGRSVNGHRVSIDEEKLNFLGEE